MLKGFVFINDDGILPPDPNKERISPLEVYEFATNELIKNGFAKEEAQKENLPYRIFSNNQTGKKTAVFLSMYRR